MSEPTSDTATTDAPPSGLETKDLPRGYGHAGVPVPDQLGYTVASPAPIEDAEAEPDVVGDATSQPGDGVADAGAAPDADAGAATPTA